MRLRHHGLGPLGAKAMAVPLIVSKQKTHIELYVVYIYTQTNTSIVKLDLEDNWLQCDGAKYIADMLKENCYIYDLVNFRRCVYFF